MQDALAHAEAAVTAAERRFAAARRELAMFERAVAKLPGRVPAAALAEAIRLRHEAAQLVMDGDAAIAAAHAYLAHVRGAAGPWEELDGGAL